MIHNRPILVSLILVLLAILCPLATSASWTWHSFPGQLHIEKGAPGSEVPYRGYDRSEWISAFGASPVLAEGHDSPFMLMATDLGAVIYCADGESWRPAALPYSGGVAVGFDPHDGNTGYAVIHKVFSQQRCALYRTRDRGQTWEHLTEAGYYRVQRSLILVNPDPEQRAHIYLATPTGIKRSLDDGASWSVIPETEGMEIRNIRFNADGTSLYVIDGPVIDADIAPGDINLYRMDLNGSDGSYTWKQLRTGDARDVEAHPEDPDRVLILNRLRRLIWSDDRGATNSEDITPSGMSNTSYTLINPANPDHILVFGWPYPQQAYRWTNDGGQTWNRPDKVNIDGVNYYPDFADYAPFNHGMPDGALIERFDSIIEGRRYVVGFWPGKPDWVVSWGITQKAKGPYLSTDYGKTYAPFGWGGLHKQHNQTAIGSSDDVIAVARVEYGVVHTANGGLWWQGSTPNTDPVIGEIQADGSGSSWITSTFHGVAIDPEDDSHWIGLYGNGPAWIIRSLDQGQTWEKVKELTGFNITDDSSFFHRRWVFWHRQNPDVIYAGSWKSTDRGQTWTELPGEHAVTDMSTENGDVVLHRAFGDYYFSRDGGQSWHEIPVPPRDPVTLSQGPERPDGRNAATVAIDPDPLRDPTVPGQFLRFIVGTRNGIVEYDATNQDATQGTWTVRDEGIVTDDDRWIQAGQAIYFASTAFDPRPGMHHIAYAGAENGSAWLNTRRTTNDKFYRQLYRSEDGGRTWNRLISDVDVTSGEVPDYMEVTGPLTVSPNTGKLYVHAWTGMYVYDPAGEADNWYGYRVLENGWVDTAPWLNWLNITFDPWIWSTSLDKYIYIGDGSGWIFSAKQ